MPGQPESGKVIESVLSTLRVLEVVAQRQPIGISELARVTEMPKSTVQLSGDAAEKVLRLIENLEENDDVQHVYANFEMDEGTIAQLESRA